MPTNKMIQIASDCDDQVFVLSTIGQGPKGEKGDTGDARFPTFADPIEWDINRKYDEFTLVLNDGKTYISQQAVPLGTSISDGNYWALANDYDAQVTDIAQRLASVSEDVDGLQASLPDEAFDGDHTVKGYVDNLRDTMEDDYVPFPESPNSKYGTANQVLSTLTNGKTQWVNPVNPSDAQAETYITAWLNDHPEATTTVQDNSLNGATKLIDGSVPDSKLVQSGGVLESVSDLKSTFEDNLGVIALNAKASASTPNAWLAEYADIELTAGKKYYIKGDWSETNGWISIRSAKSLDSSAMVKVIASTPGFYEYIPTLEEAANGTVFAVNIKTDGTSGYHFYGMITSEENYIPAIIEDELTPINNFIPLADNPDYPIGTFILGDITGEATVMPSTSRMVAFIDVPVSRLLTCDWTKYQIYVRKQVNSAWVSPAPGWKTSDYICEPAYYSLVVTRRNGSTADLTESEQNEINSVIKLKNTLIYDTCESVVDSKISIPKDVIKYTEVLPCAYGLNATKNLDNSYTIGFSPTFFYVRSMNQESGDAYISHSCNTSYSLAPGQGLYYDSDNHTLTVLSITNTPINFKYILLLWNHAGYIKGLWAAYCFNSILSKALSVTNALKTPSHRIMSRQGEGYGYPDNSLEGVTAALNDGFRMIRISVAVTNDDVFYCTHEWELANNSTEHVLKQNGVSYDNDVNINNVSSTFINGLTYKDYAIPTLDSVMSEVAKHSEIISITWELKASFTDAQLEALIDKANYYNIPVVWSAIQSDMDQLVAIDTNLNIAPIVQYTSVVGEATKTRYAGKYKTLRFDAYWTDTITATQVSTEIHPNFTLKMGATPIPTASQILSTYVKWVDVCEINYRLSSLL